MPLSNSNSLVDELAVHKLSETSKNTFHDSFTKIIVIVYHDGKENLLVKLIL